MRIVRAGRAEVEQFANEVGGARDGEGDLDHLEPVAHEGARLGGRHGAVRMAHDGDDRRPLEALRNR